MTRPSAHYRTITTRRGKVRKVINPNLHKPRKKPRYKHPKPVIGVTERNLLNDLSNPTKYKKEFGGVIDFNDSGKIDALAILPGKISSVDVPEDYEVTFHTHPVNTFNPPSQTDIISILRNNRQQGELIIQDGNVYLIKKTPNLTSLSKGKSDKQLTAMLNREVYNHIPFDDKSGNKSTKVFLKHLKSLGFDITYYPKTSKSIRVGIDKVEPYQLFGRPD